MSDSEIPEAGPKKPVKKTTAPRKKPAPKKAGEKPAVTAAAKPSKTPKAKNAPKPKAAANAKTKPSSATEQAAADSTITLEDVTDHAARSDIREGAWIMSVIPEAFKPYALMMRLDRPIGIWLLLIPSYWGLMAGMGGLEGFPEHLGLIPLLLAFTVGAVLMRGAGCIVNDLWDRDIDPEVERTKLRPIASGQISPERAMIVTAFLIGLSAMILFSMNWATIALGVVALALAVVYPIMKRITFWPQAFLGLTFNMGVLMGSTAISGGITPAAFLIYLGAISWTIAYDTIYACQDLEDDERLGMGSTALLFGDNVRLCVNGFMIVAMGFFVMAGVSAHSFGAYYAVLALPALHAFLVMRTWNDKDAGSCLSTFKAQRDFGLLMLLALLFI